ncbi:hypothetical protein I2485_04440 [Nesterenkonia sp. E16_7]|uniref:hypothetical protein n=1 Tax=unclassified Nesterenkonia TaxID=2629769 RepID=UPI001A933F28|nr:MULTISPECIES: hypothetical protein [unclassified Nesterenkonia]MBO0596713.1 hypothetical protein [Nesterenkonia sp. E16_10]MBO0597893.1 hypothetical protein [Nesterenkonia sp. E16_7]
MVNAADFDPSPRRVAGPARLTRGLLAAALAIGSAAVSHTAAGHHMPHWIVLTLALAVSLPVCASLVAVRLSRVRLGAAVVFSQAVLHGLFALFPAAGASDGAAEPSGPAAEAAAQTGHAAHDHSLTITAVADSSTTAQVLPDAPMLLAHALAALFTFAVFRRGELILQALSALLLLRPIFLLFLHPIAQTGPRAICAHNSFTTVILQDLWLGGGAQTLRGPPVLVS